MRKYYFDRLDELRISLGKLSIIPFFGASGVVFRCELKDYWVHRD